jgi:AbrB family looped-hinge helix DNA binding protein
MKMSAIVSDKGQVTIPKRLRAKLGLEPGTVLLFEERQGKLVASRVASEDPIRKLVGLGERRGVNVDRWLAEARGPAWSKELDRE